MEKYGKYGKAAICATELIRTGKCDNPREAWNIAYKEQFLPHQEASIKKGCPKGAYLGLCEEGKIEDVPEGKYTTSEKNKRYHYCPSVNQVISVAYDTPSRELRSCVL